MSLFKKTLGVTPSVAVNESRYGHDTGMVLIAMESAEELYNIFCEGTLAAEEAELDAVSEGVVLEGSQYQVVQENAIKSAYGKVKAFIEKLWAKVKAFFKQVRMHLDKIFMSGKDFVKKYDKEIQEAAKNAKDFTYKMYSYNNELIDKNVDAAKKAEDTIQSATDKVKAYVTQLAGDAADLGDKETITAASKEEVTALKKHMETHVNSARKDMCNGAVKDEDISESLFKLFRNGADSEDNKQEQKWDDAIVNILKSAKAADKINEMASKIDNGYKKAIKVIEEAEQKASAMTGNEGGQQIAEVLREYSATIAKIQNFDNQYMSAWKTAVIERNNAYKNCTMALLSHKNK